VANTNLVAGLQPISRVDGAKQSGASRMYFVPASQTNALFVGDPVVKVTGSANARGVNGVDLATAGSNAVVTGVVTGFVGASAAGSTDEPSLYGVSQGNVYRPASTNKDFYVLVNDDPEQLFSVQVTGTATLAVADVGKNFNLVSGAGSAATGLSGWTVSNTAVSAGATGQVNVIGFEEVVLNSPSSAYANVLVRLNSSTETNKSSGI